MLRLRASKISAILAALAASIWMSVLGHEHLTTRDSRLDGLENRLVDLRYRLVGPVTPAPKVVLVAIDDETLESEETKPNGRELLANVIQKIADSGAQSLVLDVLLAEAGSPDERASLASSLSLLPTVIAVALRFDENGDADVIWPNAAFAAVADIGHVNLQTDTKGTPRFVPLFVEVDGNVLPSMPLVAAINLIGAEANIGEDSLSLGSLKIALDKGAYMPLRLLGPEGTVPTLSAHSLIKDTATDALSGKLVVLGFSAAGTGDLFATPFDGEIPGAEIIATAISQLIGGPALRHDDNTRRWDVLHMVVLATVILLVFLRVPFIRAVPMAVCLMLVSFAGVTFAFAHELWLSAALPLSGALPLVLLAGTLSLVNERRVARISEQSLTSLRRFQSPAMARRIEQDPDFLRQPEQQELVVFFVDLTGFTSLSQQLGPEGTRALLQQFHELTGRIVEGHKGNVINFMGDGALAVFGFEQSPDARSIADLALQSAEDLEAELVTLPLPSHCSKVMCRTGLHYGSVVLSRLGAQNHQQVTVSGDTVNLASRLMEVAKSKNARIVATRQFMDRLSPQPISGVFEHARVEVRGWNGKVEVAFWPRAHASRDPHLS